MKVAIIVAMDAELRPLLPFINNKKKTENGGFHFYKGELFNHEVKVVKGGVGKVASALVFATIINHDSNIDLFINTGVCGGVYNMTNIHDVIIPYKVGYADADLTCLEGYKFGQMASCPPFFKIKKSIIENINLSNHKKGTILSGDAFFHREDEVKALIKNHFSADDIIAFDMETAAHAHSAYFYNKDFLAIRTVSDVIGHPAQADEFKNNLKNACKLNIEFLLEVLRQI